ncbi:MAG: ATP-grasp domain-containing protein [Gammaproteobacteria bacterium]|nr:ATP-grasp domain-containing protein [Gammaproteobacteria bacterium]MCW8986098.1 ATP-grasp domain-containing protein [Gammaproteobacteria bacterium]
MSSRSFPASLKLRDRVLVIAPHGSYRTAPFITAANQLNIDVLIASQGEHSIVSDYVKGLHIDFQNENQSIEVILSEAKKRPFSGIIGTDDVTTELAARIAEKLNLPHNDPLAVKTAQRKDFARLCLRNAKIKIPRFDLLITTESLSQQKITVNYPAVVKPVALSASRGVIRVNDFLELEQAVERIKNMLAVEHQLEKSAQETLLLEEFIPGKEVAIEGMLHAGQLDVLAIFDKPDPLEGPFFEETYYLTPTSSSEDIQRGIKNAVLLACQAYGLKEGPVHAECRINDKGVWILEVAARTIGGLCGRLLSIGTGYSLEELVLLHAMGKHVEINTVDSAAGVLMIPIPGAGILKRVEGILDAQRIPYISEVSIEVRDGYELIPLPEGNSYLGFIFAEAPTVKEAEQALRDAHDSLNIVIAPLWKIAGNIPA